MQTHIDFSGQLLSPKVKTWIHQMESGNTSNNLVVVLRYIRMHPHTTIADIRKNCVMAHQTATSVLSQLMDHGLVIQTGEREMENVFYSTLKFVEEDANRYRVMQERMRDKYVQWIRRGLTEFAQYMTDEMKHHLEELKK